MCWSLEALAVGAGLGSGFNNTEELHAMKFDEAMATNFVHEWLASVKEEYQRMINHHA